MTMQNIKSENERLSAEREELKTLREEINLKSKLELERVIF